MATKLYPRINTTSDIIGWTPTPGDFANVVGNPDSLRSLLPTAGSASHQNTLTSATGPTVVYAIGGLISPPLSAAVTISGTVTLNFWWRENAMTVNAGARCEVYKWSAATATLSSQLLSTPNHGSEMTTSATARNWTSAITSTDFEAGDRIVAVPAFTDAGGTLSTSGTVDWWDEGGTGGALGDSWVQFTETLTFDSNTPAGTTIYLTDTASDISTADDDREMWTSRGGGVTTATRTPGAGPISPTQLQRSGTNVRWYTKALDAVTLSGRVTASLWAKCSAGETATLNVELIKRTSGGSETSIAKGTYTRISTSVGMETTESARVIPMTIPATVSIATGDRLCLVVYSDDAWDVARAASITDTLYYAGTSGGASGDSFLTFTQTLAVAPVTGSFTTDAIVKATVSSSFSLDAVLQQTVSSTFTLDAVIVTEAPPTTYASDDFSDTQTDTWADADIGGTYVPTSSADLDKASGVGTLQHTVADTTYWGLTSVSATDVDYTILVKSDKLAVGDVMQIAAFVRQTTQANDWYAAEITIGTDNHVDLQLRYRTAGGTITNIGSAATDVLTDFTVDTWYKFRFQAEGTSPTTLRARFWLASGSEPGSWQVETTDSTAGLQNPGGVGGRFRTTSSNSNYPITLSWDDLLATNISGLTTVNGSFTEDAIILRTQTGSFVLDAVLKRTQESTFTLDSIVRKTASATFTIDAVIFRTYTPTFTLDSVFFRTYSVTATLDSILLRSVPGSFALDAVVLSVVSRTATFDAVVFRTYASTGTLDAVFLRASSASHTLDAVLVKTTTSAFAFDVVVFRTYPATFTLDAVTFRTSTSAFSLDAVLARTSSAAATLDAVLLRSASTTLALDAVVFRTQAGAATLDAILARTSTTSLALDAVLLRTISGSATLDAVFLKTIGSTIAVDAIVLATASTTFAFDAVIAIGRTGSATLDAIVKATVGVSYTLNAILFKTYSTSFSLDAAIAQVVFLDTFTRTVPLGEELGGSWRNSNPTNPWQEGFAALSVDGSVGRARDNTTITHRGFPLITSGEIRFDFLIPSSWGTGNYQFEFNIDHQTSYIQWYVSNGGGSPYLQVNTYNDNSPNLDITPDVWYTTKFNFPSSNAPAYTTTWPRDDPEPAAATDIQTFFDPTQSSPEQWTFLLVRGSHPTIDALFDNVQIRTSEGFEFRSLFTFNAVKLKVRAASFALDAVVMPSFTLDAVFVVSSSINGAFSLDAVLRAIASGSFAVDAIVGRTEFGTADLDAVLFRVQAGAFAFDAVLFRVQVGSFALDAVIQTTSTGGFTEDAIVLRTGTASAQLDAVIFGTTTASFALDAVVMPSFTFNSVLLRTASGSFSIDAVVMPVLTLDALIRAQVTSSFSLDAFVAGVNTYAYGLDAIFLRTNTSTFSTDALVKRTATATLTFDGVLLRNQSASFTLDAVQLQTISSSAALDAIVLSTRTAGFTVDAVVRSSQVGSLTLDALFSGGTAFAVTLDAVIKREGTASADVNAVLSRGAAGSFSLDASVRTLASGSATIDAVVLRPQLGSCHLDAVLQSTLAGSFSLSALLRTSQSGTFSLDAYVSGVTGATFAFDAILQKAVQGQLDVAAIIRATHETSLLLDAYVSVQMQFSILFDAVIASLGQGSFVTDAYLVAGIPTEIEPISAVLSADTISAQLASATITANLTADTISAVLGSDFISAQLAADTLGVT